MEPTIIDLNIIKALLKPVYINGDIVTEVHVKTLILRPFLKKIVFLTQEFNRVVIYDGEELFEAHKNDVQEVLENVLLEVIEAKYNT